MTLNHFKTNKQTKKTRLLLVWSYLLPSHHVFWSEGRCWSRSISLSNSLPVAIGNGIFLHLLKKKKHVFFVFFSGLKTQDSNLFFYLNVVRTGVLLFGEKVLREIVFQKVVLRASPHWTLEKKRRFKHFFFFNHCSAQTFLVLILYPSI